MDRVVYTIAWLLVSVIRYLPPRLCFSIGRVLGRISCSLFPRYRRLARENLFRAFGREKTTAEIEALTVEHFKTLGANLVSALRMPAMSEQEIVDCAEMVGLDLLEKAAAEGKGVVLAISHIGNWELFAQLVFLCPGLRFGTVYQAIRNRYINDFINRDRERLGVMTFDRRRGFAGPLKLLREGGVVGVLVDQHAGDGGLWTPLFHHLASTSPLAATLAIRANAPVVPVAITTIGPARWRVTLDPPLARQGDDAARLTWEINCALEKQIRQSPADWFWVHERWKTPKPDFLVGRARRGIYLPEHGRLEPFRILVRSSNWLGDAVMCMPAVRALKEGRPDAKITVLTPEKLRDLWVSVSEVDEVIGIEPGDTLLSVAARLRLRNFRAAVLFPNSLRSALEVTLGGIPRRVGYAGHRRRWLLNQIIPAPKKTGRPRHQSLDYLEMVRHMGGEGQANFRQAYSGAGDDGLVFGVCPGAEFGPAKRWPVESFRATMEEISKRIDCQWVVVGVARDLPLAEALTQNFPGKIENKVGRTSLGSLIKKIRRMDALLTNDTGTMHLAASLGTPTVAIFGSTEPDLTGPMGDFHRVLRHQVECSPCFLRECPRDFRCMAGVTPEDAVRQMLDLVGLPESA